MPRKSKRSGLAKRVNRLERTTRPEVKHYQDNVDFTTVGSVTGTLIKPQQLSQSTSRGGRVGDKVKSKNLYFQALFKMPNLPANPTCAVRILILRSKLQDPDTSDMPNWYGSVDQDKFFVIRDVLTQVSQVGQTTSSGTAIQTGSTIRTLKFSVPLGLRKMQYDGGAFSSPLNNEYVIYMIAENQSAEVAYNWRHFYIDN